MYGFDITVASTEVEYVPKLYFAKTYVIMSAGISYAGVSEVPLVVYGIDGSKMSSIQPFPLPVVGRPSKLVGLTGTIWVWNGNTFGSGCRQNVPDGQFGVVLALEFSLSSNA